MKILIVDDSKNGALALQMILVDQGYDDVHVEYSAKGAFDYLDSLPTDSPCQLVLMDIRMPEMDGIEATKWLKKHQQYKEIPVVMVSGDEDIERLKQAFNAGANDFIRKSSEETEIIARVKSTLRLKQEMENRKAHEKQLQSLTEKYKTKALEAELANRAKAQFLANMSHEIRTPMNAITGMTTLAINENKSPLVDKYLKTIQSSSQLLLTLLNDILDISKIEAGRLNMEYTEFNIRSIMEQSVTIFGSKASFKDIELILSIDNNIPDNLIGDPHRFNQVLNNLISNAIKFTSEGYISVNARMLNKEADKVTIQFEVNDTGMGIEQSNYNELFKSFTQADSSTTRKFGGTGLGLTICKNLVELMDGKIWIESKVNEGSKFIFTASFSISKKQLEKKSWLPSDEEFSDLSIVVFDDNPIAGYAIIGLLESIGLSAILVQNKQKLFDKLADPQKNPVNLLLLDNSFEDTNGLSLAKDIRQNLSLQQPDIVLMPYIGTDLSCDMIKNFGIQSFANKPLTQKNIADAIVSAIKPELLQIENNDKPIKKYIDNNIRALLVEDDTVNTEVAKGLLKELNITELDIAKNGLEGLELIKKALKNNKRYDFILMDVQMPVMDGLEATKKVREYESTFSKNSSNRESEESPIIATTAHARTEDKNRCFEAGMNDYITKPIKFNELIRVVDKFVWSKRIVSELTIDSKKENVTESVSKENDNRKDDILKPEEAISRFNGNEELFFQLLRSFKKEYLDIDQQIKNALEKNDIKNAHILAHTSKGISFTLAAPNFSVAALNLERALKHKKLDDIDVLYNNFAKELQILIQEINRILKDKDLSLQKKSIDSEKEPVQKETSLYPQIPEINIQKALNQFAGNFELFIKVLKQFYKEYQNYTAQIREAYISDNWVKVQGLAHKLKGVSKYLAADSLYDASKKLEDYVKEKQYEKIKPLLTRIENIISKISTNIKSVIQMDSLKHDDNLIIALPKNIQDRFNTLYNLLKESDSEIKDMISDFEQSLSKISLTFSAKNHLKKMVQEINSYQFDNAKQSLKSLANDCNVEFTDKEV